VALIKRADADSAHHRRVSLDLGDLARRAELMREAAGAEAERIVREAHEERRRILSGAGEEGRAAGFASGRADGLAEGRERGRGEALEEYRDRLAQTEAAWLEMVRAFEADRERLLTEGRRAVIELAVAIAERVVHRAIEMDASVVEDQLRELLALVGGPSTLVVRIHPDDEALVREVLPALREQLVGGVHIRLAPDSEVGRGSCVARTLGGAVIDASIQTQLDRLVRELLPDRAGARE
jgi:flagellar assembly protein FliH